MTLKNVKLLYESRKAIIKLLMTILQLYLRLNTNQFMQKGIPSMLARVARVAKVSGHSNLKILSPKQMLQRLQIALAHVKAGNKSENLLSEIRQIIYFLHNEFNKVVKQNRYYIYEVWEQ